MQTTKGTFTATDLQMLYDAVDVLSPDSQDGQEQRSTLLQYIARLQGQVKPEEPTTTAASAKPKFTVIKIADAYARYTTKVDADTAEQAAQLAYDGDYKWSEPEVDTFDACCCVTLDENGYAIEATETGKLTVYRG